MSNEIAPQKNNEAEVMEPNDEQSHVDEKKQVNAALKAEYKELAIQGLWKNNPGLVQLLGLCPLPRRNRYRYQCHRFRLSDIISAYLLKCHRFCNPPLGT